MSCLFRCIFEIELIFFFNGKISEKKSKIDPFLLAPTSARSVVFRNSYERFFLSFPTDKLKRIFVSFPEIPMKIRNKNKIVGGVPRKLPQRGTRVGFSLN